MKVVMAQQFGIHTANFFHVELQKCHAYVSIFVVTHIFTGHMWVVVKNVLQYLLNIIVGYIQIYHVKEAYEQTLKLVEQYN